MRTLLISFIIFLLSYNEFQAQNSIDQLTTDQSSFVNQLNEFKVMRTRDSLKMESLQNAIQELIDLQKNQLKKEYQETADSLRIQKHLSEISRIKSNTQGAPVVLEKDTLFTIYANLAAYSNTDRAKNAQNRIQLLFEDPSFESDSLSIGDLFGVKTVNYKSNVIVAVDQIDALWLGTTTDSLAQSYKNTIATSVLKAKKNNSFQTKIKRIAEVILIFAVVFSILYLINKLVRKINHYFITQNKLFTNGIYIRNYQLVPKRILNVFVSRFLLLFKYFLFVLVLASSLTIALKIFPSTEIWAKKAESILLEPIEKIYESIVSYVPNLIILTIIILGVNWLLSIIKYFANEVEQGNLRFNNFYAEWARPTYQLIRLLIVVLTLIIVFPYLPGSDTTAFQGISVFLGILISIGSSSAIANAVAGIVITYMRPFKQNDWIKTGDVTGMVIEKNSLVTRLKTINNEDVSVPNSAILSGATINYSSIGRTDGLVITTEIEIDYTIEYYKVEKLLLRAANCTQGITNRLAPYIFYKKLNDSTTTFEINAITFEPQNMYFIKSDLIKNIQKVFVEEKVPLRSVSIVQIEPNKN